jgi:2-oxoglutarate ferredoxin oxidoreductase subunit alpha
MSPTDSAVQDQQSAATKQRVINDFSIQVATVNGSGSQTANLVLLRSILLSGVPVSGKNMFPSNIAGLPTWYTIRASKRGYIARKKEVDFLVAMNPETAKEDVLTLDPGAAVVYDEPLKLNSLRSDLVFYPVPFDKLVQPVCPDAKLRRLVRNMIYDGILAKLLGIDLSLMEQALAKQLGKKAKAVTLNTAALKAGWDYAEANFTKQDPFWIERMNETAGKILIEGNAAAAIGCMMAGVTVVAWYPITPSSSLCESLIGYMKKYRVDKETGKATFAIVQAEDEIASLGMVIGASWAGARSMTSTAGPGISLMGEFVGLAYYTEAPAVIFDVQRVGPSTGLPTRTAQGDLMQVAFHSHGDTKHMMLIPSSVEECYTMAQEAFDLAEHFQTPVFVMLDLDLGMNNWMSDGFKYPTEPINRGKMLTPEVLKKLGEWGRYKDVDGDGIPYRTIPGDGMPAYFARGSGHNAKGQYSERPDDYVENMDRLARKFETARKFVPKPEVDVVAGAKIGLLGYGTTHWAVTESRDQLREETDVKASYFRLRGYPFNEELVKFIDAHERIYVIEQNRDAQLLQLMKLDLTPDRVAKLRSVLHYNGLPIDARSVSDDVLAQEGYEVANKTSHRNIEAGLSGMTGGE